MKSSGVQPTPTYTIWGKEASKWVDRQEENEEIQRRRSRSHNPAYDEAKHSSELENDRASH
jgi:hypothetical protein